TPRSWADAAKVENLAVEPDQRRALVASCVGAAAATEFAHFIKVYKRVDVNAIVQRVGGDVAALVALRSGGPARRRPDKKRRSPEKGSAS
ncbi:MAG: hypothetical protein HYV46_08620, partial [candidate division NC10 bacterium]|nr:hypothetical protein [candidate division NC10 bacterium]